MIPKKQNKIAPVTEKHLIREQYNSIRQTSRKSNSVTELAGVIKDWQHRKELESVEQEMQLKQILEQAKRQKSGLNNANNKTAELRHIITQLKNELK